MQDYALKKRKERAWERINTAIENEDTKMLDRLDEFNTRSPDNWERSELWVEISLHVVYMYTVHDIC